MTLPLRCAVVFFALYVSVFVYASTPAQAMPILQVDNGILTGATGVDVGGTLYDVTFLDGTCIALFNGCDQSTDFVFQPSSILADQASEALFTQVFLDGPQGNFDTSPFLTRGCTDPNQCAVFTPFFLVDSSDVRVSAAFNNDLEAADGFLAGGAFNPATDTTNANGIVYAVWSPTAVPIPDGMPVGAFTLGFLALAAYEWRQRRQAGMQVG